MLCNVSKWTQIVIMKFDVMRHVIGLCLSDFQSRARLLIIHFFFFLSQSPLQSITHQGILFPSHSHLPAYRFIIPICLCRTHCSSHLCLCDRVCDVQTYSLLIICFACSPFFFFFLLCAAVSFYFSHCSFHSAFVQDISQQSTLCVATHVSACIMRTLIWCH